MLVLSGIYYHYFPRCVRISVHVCADDNEKAIEETFNMYLKAKITAADYEIRVRAGTADHDESLNHTDRTKCQYCDYEEHPFYLKFT
jgi:hypothetical protein